MSATIAPAAAPSQAPNSKGSGATRLLVVVSVLVAVAAAVWFFLLAPEGEAAPAEVADGVIVALEPQTTTTGTAALHHARVALGLVLVEGADETVVTARSALLQDALLQEIAAMDADQLRSADGSDLLRTNLTEHAQRIWPDGEVRRVVLTELLVQ